MQDSLTHYLLCAPSDECVADHSERITHENRHMISCNFHESEARPLVDNGRILVIGKKAGLCKHT